MDYLDQLLGILERSGLSLDKRPLSALFSNNELNQKVFAQQFVWTQSINRRMKGELICFTTDSQIPLKRFMGCQVAVDERCADGSISRATGIITEAKQGASDGSLTTYLLTIEDPLSLWDKRTNNRVFLNKSIIDVVKILHQEWCQRSQLYAVSAKFDFSGLTQDYEIRTQINQRSESDFALYKRLLAEYGVNYYIFESSQFVSNFKSAIQPLKICLIDDNRGFKSARFSSIQFHRSDATERQDSLTSIIAKRTLQPTQVHAGRWRADYVDQEDTLVVSSHQHSETVKNHASGLEVSLLESPASINDLNDADGAAKASFNQLEKLAKNKIKHYDLLTKEYTAQGTVRGIEVGTWFTLTGYEQVDGHTGSNNEYLITSKTSTLQNNLPKDLNDQFNLLLKQSDWLDKIRGE